MAKVEVAAPPADPLTVTADGVWIDLRVTPPGATAPVDLTERLKVTERARRRRPHADARRPPRRRDRHRRPPRRPRRRRPARRHAAPSSPSTAAGATWSRCATTRWASPSPAATAGTARWPRPRRADAKFGTREISAPVDRGVAADARARDAQRQGGYAALEGEAFALRDGIGEDGSSTTQAIAFAADGTGFTGGTIAFGAVSRARADPRRPRSRCPCRRRDRRRGDRPERRRPRLRPGPVARARCSTRRASGWSRAFTPLLEIGAPAARHRLAAPEPADRRRRRRPAGDGQRRPAQPSTSASRTRTLPHVRVANFDALQVEDTVLAIACTPADPLDCVAVGLDGLIVRGDGTNWRIQHLPDAAPEHTHITGVAFDGRTPLLATTDGLYVGQAAGDDYVRDDDLRARMAAAGLPAAVRTVATVAGGGVAVDGRFARDSATAPWRPTAAPLALHPYALAAYRGADGAVRAIVSATPDLTPLPEPFEPDDDEPDDDERQPPLLAPSPADAVALRETADGWIDLDRSRFQRSGGRDLPDMTPNTRAILVDADGSGVLLGGVSDASTTPIYRGGPDAPTLGGEASVRRLDHGALAPAPADTSEAAETPGAARLGAPRRRRPPGVPGPLRRRRRTGLRARHAPAGRDRPRAGDDGRRRRSRGAADRWRARLARRRAARPRRSAPLPRAHPGRRRADVRAARSGRPPERRRGGVRLGVRLRTRAPGHGRGARRHRAPHRHAARGAGPARPEHVRVRRPGGRGHRPGHRHRQRRRPARGRARRSAGPLDPRHAGAGARGRRPRRSWSAACRWTTARTRSPRRTPTTRSRCSPAARRPTSRPPGWTTPPTSTSAACWPRASSRRPAAPLRLLQSSTLGYAPSQKFTVDTDDELSARQTHAALLVLDVAVDSWTRTPGSPPCRPCPSRCCRAWRSISASRSIPLGWAFPLFVTAGDPSPRRFLMSPGPGEPLRPASPRTVSGPLTDQCRFFVQLCSTVVPTAHDVRVLGPPDRPLRRGPPRRQRARRVVPRWSSTPPGTSSTIRAASCARSRSGRSTSPSPPWAGASRTRSA